MKTQWGYAEESAAEHGKTMDRRGNPLTIKLRGVAVFRMTAVSVISTMNVERPRARLSLAPMRVKTRSTTLSLADRAGTNDPICARITISAVCRK